MKRLSAVLCILLLVTFAHAQQTWQRTYGGTGDDQGNSVQQTSDGGYIVTGTTYSFGAGNGDVWLIKTDASGDTLWTRTYGGIQYDYGYSVQQTSDGGYVIAGNTASYGGGYDDFYLIKTNVSGDTIWTRTYGFGRAFSSSAFSAQQTQDGGYIVAGRLGNDVYLVKTNASGDTLWTKTYGGTGDDAGYSVQQTQDGGYIVAGRTNSYGPDGVYVIKTDASGDTLWTRTYGGTVSSAGYSVRQTADGGYIIAGEIDPHGGGSYDVYLIKTNASGDTLWTRTYGGTVGEGGRFAQQTPDGGYIVAGGTSSFGAGGWDVWLIKTNASGDTLWARTYGGTGTDIAFSAQQTTDGGYIIAGETGSFGAGQYDVYLIKTDGNGNVGIEEQSEVRCKNDPAP